MSENGWPQTTRQQIGWLQERIGDWAENADDLGLNEDQLGDLQTMLTQVVNNMTAASTARSVAKGKTHTFHASAEPLIALAGGLIKTIRARAITSGDAAIYELARINPPAPASPAPPPAKPTDLRVTIDPSSGALTLRWKASNPRTSGTSYIIRRRTSTESTFSFIGTSGSKSFTDSSFTAGPSSVAYTVQGTRSGISGELSNIFTIKFGAPSADGTLQAFVTDEGPEGAKLAA